MTQENTVEGAFLIIDRVFLCHCVFLAPVHVVEYCDKICFGGYGVSIWY